MLFNQDLAVAIKHEKAGRFEVALEHYNWALEFALYKLMWSVAECTAIQEGRFRCFRAIAAHK